MRKREPTALQELKGWSRKKGKAIDQYGIEPEPEKGFPDEPEHIKQDQFAHEEWVSVCEQLHSMQILTVADRPLIEFYCAAYSEWRKAMEMERKYGTTFVSKRSETPMTYPWVKHRTAAHEKCVKCLSLLGLSPTDRAKMRVAGVVPKEKNTLWENFIPRPN